MIFGVMISLGPAAIWDGGDDGAYAVIARHAARRAFAGSELASMRLGASRRVPDRTHIQNVAGDKDDGFIVAVAGRLRSLPLSPGKNVPTEAKVLVLPI